MWIQRVSAISLIDELSIESQLSYSILRGIECGSKQGEQLALATAGEIKAWEREIAIA
jgi:hypothetical protein